MPWMNLTLMDSHYFLTTCKEFMRAMWSFPFKPFQSLNIFGFSKCLCLVEVGTNQWHPFKFSQVCTYASCFKHVRVLRHVLQWKQVINKIQVMS